MEKTICYKDLSTSLKVAVVLAWVSGAFICLSFILGFISGFFGI